MEDAGSGALFDLRPYGLDDEPVIGDSIAAGVDLVIFSGDKLLGAAQAGLVVGRGELINRLRRIFYRALRATSWRSRRSKRLLDAKPSRRVTREVRCLVCSRRPASSCRTHITAFVELVPVLPLRRPL